MASITSVRRSVDDAAELLQRPDEIRAVLEVSQREMTVPALGGMFNAENAHDVKAQVVVEAANSPTSEEADRVLAERGSTVIPDILANAGGVTGSYFEWTQNIQQFTWTRDRFEKELEVCLGTAYQATRALSSKKTLELHLAAYCIGIGRVAEAVTLRILLVPEVRYLAAKRSPTPNRG